MAYQKKAILTIKESFNTPREAWDWAISMFEELEGVDDFETGNIILNVHETQVTLLLLEGCKLKLVGGYKFQEL